MNQAETVGAVEESVGYVLKQAAAALRAAMDAALRPLDLTVPQYACLEVLEQRPGQSNAELARSVFVSRQAMNGVLRGLQDRDLVTRAATASRGRALPTELTATGRDRLLAASTAVRAVERQMLATLDVPAQTKLREDLAACARALSEDVADRADEVEGAVPAALAVGDRLGPCGTSQDLDGPRRGYRACEVRRRSAR